MEKSYNHVIHKRLQSSGKTAGMKTEHGAFWLCPREDRTLGDKEKRFQRRIRTGPGMSRRADEVAALRGAARSKRLRKKKKAKWWAKKGKEGTSAHL